MTRQAPTDRTTSWADGAEGWADGAEGWADGAEGWADGLEDGPAMSSGGGDGLVG